MFRCRPLRWITYSYTVDCNAMGVTINQFGGHRSELLKFAFRNVRECACEISHIERQIITRWRRAHFVRRHGFLFAVAVAAKVAGKNYDSLILGHTPTQSNPNAKLISHICEPWLYDSIDFITYISILADVCHTNDLNALANTFREEETSPSPKSSGNATALNYSNASRVDGYGDSLRTLCGVLWRMRSWRTWTDVVRFHPLNVNAWLPRRIRSQKY